ncbi:hypothetical protein ACFE04_003738 [Oxalis oulophora]
MALITRTATSTATRLHLNRAAPSLTNLLPSDYVHTQLLETQAGSVSHVESLETQFARYLAMLNRWKLKLARYLAMLPYTQDGSVFSYDHSLDMQAGLVFSHAHSPNTQVGSIFSLAHPPIKELYLTDEVSPSKTYPCLPIKKLGSADEALLQKTHFHPSIKETSFGIVGSTRTSLEKTNPHPSTKELGLADETSLGNHH